MLIRPETVADYAAIGAVHALAFGHRAGEAAIVALLRQQRAFDPAGLLNDYLARVRASQRPPGRVIWPVAFDLG